MRFMAPTHYIQGLFVEFGRAFAAARRYESLKCGRAQQESLTLADIPRRIFEEFYSGERGSEDWSRSLHRASACENTETTTFGDVHPRSWGSSSAHPNRHRS
jgi:hypothetical protein